MKRAPKVIAIFIAGALLSGCQNSEVDGGPAVYADACEANFTSFSGGLAAEDEVVSATLEACDSREQWESYYDEFAASEDENGPINAANAFEVFCARPSLQDVGLCAD